MMMSSEPAEVVFMLCVRKIEALFLVCHVSLFPEREFIKPSICSVQSSESKTHPQVNEEQWEIEQAKTRGRKMRA